MNKEFVPYEQALELKELGFDDYCYGFYGHDNLLYRYGEVNYIVRTDTTYSLAPLYQQAFRWFRDKKLSDACVCRYQSRGDGGVFYYYCINHDFGIEETKHFKEGFFSYEEAELACLNKLIEIIKEESK